MKTEPRPLPRKAVKPPKDLDPKVAAVVRALARAAAERNHATES